jgi:hypothetical protein
MPDVTYFHEVTLEDVPEGQLIWEAQGLPAPRREL